MNRRHHFARNFSDSVVVALCFMVFTVLRSVALGDGLEQGLNGTFATPVSPVTWQAGEAGTNDSHYTEGQSIPFRLTLNGLTNGSHSIVIEWDIKTGGFDALDYITDYRRIAEAVDPTAGLTGPFTSDTFSIPAPIPSLIVNGLPQPQTSFNALSSGESIITLFNGNFITVAYVTNALGTMGDLSAAQSSVDLEVDFVTTNSTIVLAWGGHIASQQDWGAGNTASGVAGLAYHTRVISVDGVPQPQEALLDAPAVCLPPTNSIAGPSAVCSGTTNSYTDTSDGVAITWSVTGNATLVGPATNSTLLVQAGSPGPYTVTATSMGLAGCSSSSAVTANINPLPSCSIEGPSSVCPGSTNNIYSAPLGMTLYSWSIDGSGLLLGDTNQASVVVASGTNCGTNFTLSLNLIDSNGCVSACTQIVPVTNLLQPAFMSFPADATIECPNDTSPAATGTPTGSDGCSFTLSFQDVVVDGNCSNQVVRTIARTWTLSDLCGNTSNQTQLVTVKDTTPPSFITFPADAIVECPNSTTPDATGQPTGTDTCSVVSLSYNDITTDGACSNQVVKTISRTWTLTDACGNSSNQVQTITVKDTTPPSFVTFPADTVVECSHSTMPDATGQPTGTDTCSVVTITFADAVVDGNCSNQVVKTITRTWTLADACGNTSNMAQVITVRDTTPPEITCQSNVSVAEAPRDSGVATITFPPAKAVDACDPNPLVVSVPASGSILPVGSNTVTCIATDACGNSNSCTFDIRVIPYRLPVTNTADSGPGSLRQALLDANDSPDENLVYFRLSGSPPFVVHLLSALPEITSPLILDGWSQSGSNAPPVVVLDGSGATNPIDGLVLTAPSNTIRGLVFSGFNIPLRLQTNGYNLVEGNYIGTDASGTNAVANAGDGIFVTSSGNTIGGLVAGEGNVISGNLSNGIEFASSGAVSNVVEGNFIGLGADGVTPAGNQLNGVRLGGQAAYNTVGGTTSNAANVIAFNDRDGVSLAPDAGLFNAIIGNRIFSNGRLGIELGDNGVILNGSLGTNGPNAFQPFPILTDAQSISGTTTIYGQFTGTPFTTYRLDFYLDDTPDPTGYGQGQMFIGSYNLALNGSGTASFAVPFALTAVYTQFVSSTATDPSGNTSEFSAVVPVRTPPVLQSQPVSTNAPAGDSVAFCATAVGTPPIFYQWRHNGINIPDATNQCYFISAADVTNGGSYTVIVGNVLGALSTEIVSLTLPVPDLQGSDYFSNRVTITGESGQFAGQNINATSEPGEPLHAGKPGGKSVWYTWTPTDTGVATMETVGSTFDTLLGIYTGTVVSNLTIVDNDVSSGGFYTSKAMFNAINNHTYQIAIDGFAGQSGQYVFSWNEIDTPHLLPAFTTQPTNITVNFGDTATFYAIAQRVCGEGHINCPNPLHYPPEDELPNLSFQWYFYGSPIPGATSNVLTIPNVQASALGNYTLAVSTPWETNLSHVAILQINSVGGGGVQGVQAWDQFQDSLDSNPLFIGALSPGDLVSSSGPQPLAAVVSGYTGTQVFNTGGSGTSPNEVICGTIGGASEWLTYVPLTSGTLFLNTEGSSFSTVMAVFRRNPTNSTLLQQLACDGADSGTNGKTSSVSFPVTAGVTNYVDVDGVNGVTGVLQFNYSLVNGATLKSLGLTPQQNAHLQVSGQPAMHFTIQASTDLVNWVPLVTTNAPGGLFDYIDTTSPGIPQRFYRALMLP